MANDAPVKSNPVGLDKAAADIQAGLSEGLPWLDAAFGVAQRMTTKRGDRTYIVPCVWCGGWRGHGPDDYIEVGPDSKIGNFSFVLAQDPQRLDGGPWARTIRAPFSVVFWFDLRRVWGTADRRDTETLKAQALRILSGREGWVPRACRIRLDSIYDEARNIYPGFDLSEIDNQYLAHPYGGFRIEGELQYPEDCLWIQ